MGPRSLLLRPSGKETVGRVLPKNFPPVFSSPIKNCADGKIYILS